MLIVMLDACCADLITELFAMGYNPDADLGEGFTAVYFAAFQGHLDALQALLDAGAHFTRQDASGTTPLLVAVHAGQITCVQLLLAAGKAVRCRDPCLDPSLVVAAMRGDVHMMRLLITAGAALTGIPVDNCWLLPRTPLMGAAVTGQLDAMQLLLSYPVVRATINARGADAGSAAATAAVKQHTACLWLLQRHGAVLADDGEPALPACVEGNAEHLRAILACGLETNGPPGTWLLAMSIAAGAVDALQVLLGSGLLHNADTDSVGMSVTVMLMAAQAGRSDMLAALLATPAVAVEGVAGSLLQAYCALPTLRAVDRGILRQLVMVRGGRGSSGAVTRQGRCRAVR